MNENLNPENSDLSNEEMDVEKKLRPLSFDDFTGQEQALENLKIFVEAANRRGEALDHTLFHGPPGLGKTTLANILANELNVGIKVTSGPVLDKPGDLAGLLTGLDERDVLFIDEIHRLSPVVEEYLFWFLGHPEVYIVLLPALGITSEVIATNSRKPIFGYRAMIGSIMAIAFLSTIVWGHHMFVSGMNPFLGSVFTFTTLLIAIPSAVKAFNYITTLWKGNLQMNPAMLFSIGLVSTFITGGLTGIVLGDSALDINVHDTYFVVAHFHLVMGVSAIYGMFAGVYHWFPKMYGRMMNKTLGYWHFWITAIAAYGVFFPMHFIGLAGLPRRYYSNTAFPLFDDLADVNIVITMFAILGGIAQIIFLVNFFLSIFKGKEATQNPWKSTTLEWTTPVERIHGNWPGKIPTVTRWAYDYSKPGHDVDFVPQDVPLKDGEEES